MEEKLTFTRVPRSVYWLCCSNFQQSKKSLVSVVDYFQTDPFLNQLFKKALPASGEKSSLEAQLAGHGVKGFRNRLCELYLNHLENGFYPNDVVPDSVLDVEDFESRFEKFSTLGNFRIFLLGMYLKMKDIENLKIHKKETSFLAVPIEVDEILENSGAKTQKPDWAIVVLSSLLKFWSKEALMDLSLKSGQGVLENIPKLDDKSKMIFFNDIMSYGHAVDEKDFFLYQKV